MNTNERLTALVTTLDPVEIARAVADARAVYADTLATLVGVNEAARRIGKTPQLIDKLKGRAETVLADGSRHDRATEIAALLYPDLAAEGSRG